MKKNGFVQAVTQAINDGHDQTWAVDYWMGQPCDWADNRRGPAGKTVTHGPEFREFVLMKEMMTSRAFRNQVASTWW